jgi:hypothetical protein
MDMVIELLPAVGVPDRTPVVGFTVKGSPAGRAGVAANVNEWHPGMNADAVHVGAMLIGTPVKYVTVPVPYAHPVNGLSTKLT